MILCFYDRNEPLCVAVILNLIRASLLEYSWQVSDVYLVYWMCGDMLSVLFNVHLRYYKFLLCHSCSSCSLRMDLLLQCDLNTGKYATFPLTDLPFKINLHSLQLTFVLLSIVYSVVAMVNNCLLYEMETLSLTDRFCLFILWSICSLGVDRCVQSWHLPWEVNHQPRPNWNELKDCRFSFKKTESWPSH